MREAASRGFFLGSKAPFGYRRVKVNDGVKERPTLKVDPATAPVVKEIFESSLSGNGLKEICKVLNDRGITNRGKRWYNKGGLHYLLTNEAYTGTAVWGRTSKGEKAQDPVRVEGAWPALVSKELFEAVQEAMRERAPKVRRPARVGSRFLLSGLLRCGVCGRPYSAQARIHRCGAALGLEQGVRAVGRDGPRSIPINGAGGGLWLSLGAPMAVLGSGAGAGSAGQHAGEDNRGPGRCDSVGRLGSLVDVSGAVGAVRQAMAGLAIEPARE